MSNQITYDDKVDLNIATDVQDINKVTAADMNEIKQVVNAIDTETNTNITEILQAINNPTYTTTEGTDLSIDNTRVGKMKFEYYGDTEQESTNGYNLLPYQEFVTKTMSGVTFTNNNDGTYTVNGTATADASVVVYDTFMAMSGTWRMLGCPTGGSASTYMLSAYVGYWGEGSPNIDTGNGTNITYTGNVKIRFYIKNGTTCNNLIFKPMLTTNTSLTINDFEKYTGGIASPNPDYQQEVKTVTGENTIDIVGKNFFDIGNSLSTWFQTADNGIKVNYNIVNRTTATINGNKLTVNSYDNTGWTWISKWINLKPNTTYTISGTNTQGIKIVGFNSQEIASTGTLISTKAPNNTFITFNTGNYNYYALSLYPAGADNYIENIQIEIGSTASTYEAFKGQSYEVNLGANIVDCSEFNTTTSGGITVTPYWGESGLTFIKSSGTFSATGYFNIANNIKLQPNTKYTINKSNYSGAQYRLREYDANNTQLSETFAGLNDVTITSNSNVHHAVLQIVFYTTLNAKFYPQITRGTIAKKYQPYFTPIELCDIEEHQDFIYDNGGKWFKHKEVGKIKANGTENISLVTTGSNYTRFNMTLTGVILGTSSTYTLIRSNYYTPKYAIEPGNIFISSTQNIVSLIHNSVITLADYKTWLETNTPEIYYVLATPIEEEITEPTLINQLNAIKYGAESYYGQTNIMITSEKLQPILKVQTLDKIGE